ncbi:hypothetical protein PV10_06480 [Exophiala mesophila]|uniref:Uncharacterized protein n=1 Tax=Exophiala mesophila TaxID=212818 RepID=A0A0D1ZYU7_EXOME|nr:uncharacterized protein PV10_06480 [Exophiala mesophila]KIV91998.1 hypothetical protein PV10_06480 [Exophiala mesophila]
MGKPSEFTSIDDQAEQAHTGPPSYDSIPTDHHPSPSLHLSNSQTSRRGSLDLAQELDRVLSADQVLTTEPVFPTGQDGRISLHFGKDTAKLYKLFVTDVKAETPSTRSSSFSDAQSTFPEFDNLPPHLNIVIQVVGSRGDVQPFLALAKRLQLAGHRVRLATHPIFQSLAESHGIEFFSIGGDPAELMAYMVRNPGLMPKFETVARGEVYKRRKTIGEMMLGCWKSCYEPSSTQSAAKYKPFGRTKSTKSAPQQSDPIPFVADAIIANPPSFAHIHCAEKLGIPLYIVFTMPWSPTKEFPHPLVDINMSGVDVRLARFLSYFLVDAIIWQGLGSVINRFRYQVLGLEPINPTLAPGMLHRLRIPHYYCWSPTLIPKPSDWRSSISVPGYFLLPSPTKYNMPEALQQFLDSGSRPIFIGFGSIVIDDPDGLTSIILRALELTGVRAILARGWGSLKVGEGFNSSNRDNIFVLHGDIPHDQLFQKVSVVVHHGGAGTTASSLTAGRPSIVVPFFGDQFFWGNMVFRAGIGPAPIPYSTLKAEDLASAIQQALEPSLQLRARDLGSKVHGENGLETTIQLINADLHKTRIPRCILFPDHIATYHYTPKSRSSAKGKSKNGSSINLSPLAAVFLRKHNLIPTDSFEHLAILRYTEHNVSSGPFEPVSGAAWAVLDLLWDSIRGMGEMLTEVGHIPYLGVKAFDKGKVASRASSSSVTQDMSCDHSPPSSTDNDVRHSLPGTYLVRGTARVLKAAARAPGAFTSAMATGAHNLPLLYHDPTVRPTPVVRDISSGIKAGTSGLAYGVYDGIAGIFTQPIMGALEPWRNGDQRYMDTRFESRDISQDTRSEKNKTNGNLVQASALGFAKGLVKGGLGCPVKFFAAASAIVGYPLKGIDASVSKVLRRNDIAKTIRSQRAMQGEREYYAESFSPERVREVQKRWLEIVDKTGMDETRV